jgi:cyclophilin family peptidyl-prolyl cis-trans isomerase/HEAT repeat protein
VPVAPDLVTMLDDAEGRVRRRAAIAIGRVGLAEGVEPLGRLLATDPDPEVRQAAAFALGILGDRGGVPLLARALGDSSPLVQAHAAEGLGLLDAKDQAGAIAGMAAGYVAAGALKGVTSDDLTYPMRPEAEAVRLALYALARLKSFDGVAKVALDATGQPLTTWWPVAYALRRVEDPRAAAPLMALLASDGQYARAFAARGLGVLHSRDAIPALLPLAADVARQPAVGVEAIRALGAVRAAEAVPELAKASRLGTIDPAIRAEAVTSIGGAGSPADADLLLDLLSDRAAAVRAATFRSLAALDPERFLLALSGLDPDPEPSVRAAIASACGTLPGETAARLLLPVRETDARVLPAVFAALAAAKLPAAEGPLVDALRGPDVVVRAAAADALGSLKATGAVPALQSAYEAAKADADYGARASILDAIAAIDPAAAGPLLTGALGDREWAVRLRAAALLERVDPARDSSAAIRPAPTTLAPAVYESQSILAPKYSTHAYLDTDKGTIELELAMVDAPLTVHNFVTLARKGFYDGLSFHRVVGNFVIQDGDPRGDGEGGPGYTVRDELNARPYLRGTLGMALAGPDTGGSQYFITHSPQPHLDGRYTVFGHVVNGMEVVDAIAPGDVIHRVRIWDGAGQ